jgi:hypothetical protein
LERKNATKVHGLQVAAQPQLPRFGVTTVKYLSTLALVIGIAATPAIAAE